METPSDCDVFVEGIRFGEFKFPLPSFSFSLVPPGVSFLIKIAATSLTFEGY
jgi:hypothetical protein